METLWKNNLNSVTKVYDIQHANIIIVVNIVSKGGGKRSITLVPTFVISQSTSLLEHMQLTTTRRVSHHLQICCGIQLNY